MTTYDITCIHTAQNAPKLSLLTRILTSLSLGRQRCQLGKLSDAALMDIGVTRDEALREAQRPIWDAPAHFRR